jgi:TolB-like protein/Flp pilus assembly protein TadD
MKCLAKQPADRYTSAAEMARDLERWLAGDTVSARAALRTRRMRRWGLVALGVVLIAGLAAGAWRAVQSSSDRGRQGSVTTSQAALRSIGVMAFRNLSGSPDDDYLSWTVTDDLLHELRQIRSLNVVPFRVEMDSSRGFRPAELASRLGVEMVLDGDYRRSDHERLAVRARLWDAKTGRALWQYSFEAPLGDAREIRSQIATALVTRLQIEVGADLLAQFGRDSVTESPEAYTNYLRARYLVRWRRHETLAEAARLLRKAIALDPQFARAYSALAYTYILWVGDAPPEGQEWDLALAFARRALELDPLLAEPHAVLADYYSIKGQHIEAELDFRKAVELDPRDPATLHLYAVHLYSMGRLQEARDVERRSVALDSTSPQPMMWLAMLTTTIGDREEARRLWAQTDELGAARPICAAISRLSIGEKEPLAEWYRTSYAEAKVPEQMRGMKPLLAGVVDSAHREEARQWLQRLEGEIEPAFLITHYALLGDADAAFRVAASFNLVDDEYYHYQLCNIWSPLTASMRRDPRFGALMQRWGFIDYWQRFGPPDACSLAGGNVSCR